MFGKENEASDSMVRSKMVKHDGSWKCTDCSFMSDVNRLYKHVETSHVTVVFVCHLCQKPCKSRDSLFAHRYRYHRAERKYAGACGLDGEARFFVA